MNITRSPRTVLLICTRRIGDVLLATAALRALRMLYREARIDMLVFDGTQGVVSANPDLNELLTIAERPDLASNLRLLRRIWRRYDLAVSLLPGDRPTLYAWAAGRVRAGTLSDDSKSRWKRRLLHHWTAFDNLGIHTVAMNLRVVAQLGASGNVGPVVSWTAEDEPKAAAVCAPLKSGEQFAVLHVSPKYAYKTWSMQGWSELAHWLQQQGLAVVVAGGGSAEELRYVESLMPGFPDSTVNVAGKMGLGALGFLLSRATLYVGTDTAVTHMAASTGVSTVALFGPSNPVKWGPWPRGFPGGASPWKMRGSACVGNVYLVQGEKHCVPCLLEGCDRHVGSLSECLQQMPASRVIGAVTSLRKAANNREEQARAD